MGSDLSKACFTGTEETFFEQVNSEL
jgi:hypothetical protein